MDGTSDWTRRTFLGWGTAGVLAFWSGCRSERSGLDEGGQSSAQEPRSPIVDTHMHIWAADLQRYPFKKGVKPPEPAGTAEMLVEEMDTHGVDHCVILSRLGQRLRRRRAATVSAPFPHARVDRPHQSPRGRPPRILDEGTRIARHAVQPGLLSGRGRMDDLFRTPRVVGARGRTGNGLQFPHPHQPTSPAGGNGQDVSSRAGRHRSPRSTRLEG